MDQLIVNKRQFLPQIQNQSRFYFGLGQNQTTPTTLHYGLEIFFYSYHNYHKIEEVIMNTTSQFLFPISLCISLASIAIVAVQSPSDSIFPSQNFTRNQVEDGEDYKHIQSSVFDASFLVFIMLITTICFAIVARYNCICILNVYMIVSTAVLLTLLGGNFFLTIIECANQTVDDVLFSLFIGTFTIFGLICIFYPDRVPSFMTQMYLMIIAVIAAWNLSQLDVYTIWSLLIILVFYDIFAVLCPCGPLKQLLKADRLPEGLVFEIKLHKLGDERNLSTGSSRSSSQRVNNIILPVSDLSPIDTRKISAGLYKKSTVDLTSLSIYSEKVLIAQHVSKIEPLSSPSPSPCPSPSPSPTISRSPGGSDMSNTGSFMPLVLAEEGALRSYKDRFSEYSYDEIESIKLGLGDFVFLSLMVGEGAKTGYILFFALWASSMLVSFSHRFKYNYIFLSCLLQPY